MASIFKEDLENIKTKEKSIVTRKPFFSRQISKNNQNLISNPIVEKAVIVEDSEKSSDAENVDNSNIEVVHDTVEMILNDDISVIVRLLEIFNIKHDNILSKDITSQKNFLHQTARLARLLFVFLKEETE